MPASQRVGSIRPWTASVSPPPALIVAAIVYFFVVKPYEAAKARFARTETDAAPDPDVVLLTEIRDLLAGATGTAGRHADL